MGILDKISAVRGAQPKDEVRYSFNDWAADAMIFGGGQYGLGLNTTYGSQKVQEVTSTLPGYASAIRRCPPAFASELVRSMVLSQAHFTFRDKKTKNLFGTKDLIPLEQPFPGATTGELLTRMEWHAGLAGNAFAYRAPGSMRLRVLRPDWVGLIYGSNSDPELAQFALDGELIGYAYWNGGPGVGKPQILLPEEVAHWSPIPDPLCAGVGMSWLTPAIRDMQGDGMAAAHKIKFFEQGASPNLVIKGIPAPNEKAYNEAVDMMESRHAGLSNAYRTLYLMAGADATVIGSNFQQMDFKAITGVSETRIAFLSRVPAVLLGISEGLSGSSLNQGNFTAARRTFADTWVYPTLQDLAACLSGLVTVPPGAELWFDGSDIPLLREDAKDAADIEHIKSTTIRTLVDGGFEPGSVVAAVQAQNMGLLVHTGFVSVQLQLPGAPTSAPTPPQAA